MSTGALLDCRFIAGANKKLGPSEWFPLDCRGNKKTQEQSILEALKDAKMLKCAKNLHQLGGTNLSVNASQLLRCFTKLGMHLKLARKRTSAAWSAPEILKLQFFIRGLRSIYRKGVAPRALCEELATTAEDLAKQANKEPEIEDSQDLDNPIQDAHNEEEGDDEEEQEPEKAEVMKRPRAVMKRPSGACSSTPAEEVEDEGWEEQ